MATSLPRSLRTKTKLVSRTAVVRKPEFRAVEEMATEATEVWRKSMKNCFQIVRELERKNSCTLHGDNFFKIVDSLISFKTTYDYERLSNNQKKFFKNSKKSLLTLAWLKIFTEFENERNEPENSTATEAINIETIQTDITIASDKEKEQPSAADVIEAESTTISTGNTLSQLTPPTQLSSLNSIQKEVTQMQSATSIKPHHWLNDLSTYLNQDVKEIKEKLFKDNEMQNTISILSTVKNDPVKYSVILHLSHFISTLLPLITTSITDAYKSMLRDRRAQEIAEAEKKKRNIETTTSSIASALSNEKTMPSAHMDDILEKKVDKKIKKSLAKNLKARKQVTFAKGLNKSNQSSTSPNNIPKKKGSPSNSKNKRKPINHPNTDKRQKTKANHSPNNTSVKGKKKKWNNKWNRSSEKKGKEKESHEE